LLLDGIGDTIRISLTEDPWKEIDPCKRLKDFIATYPKAVQDTGDELLIRQGRAISTPLLLHPQGSNVLSVTDEEILSASFFEDLGCYRQFGKLLKGKMSPDVLFAVNLTHPLAVEKAKELHKIIPCIHQREDLDFGSVVYHDNIPADPAQSFVLSLSSLDRLPDISINQPAFILFAPMRARTFEVRQLYALLQQKGITSPVVLAFSYAHDKHDVVINASTEIGSLLVDRLAEGVCLSYNEPVKERLSLSFAIMQAARLRTVKTEFISCPGCGRTLFELQSVSARIREKTSHLPGVKIAIMGCIVNGPGEMADADFGYVGSRPGKIDLYVGKNCVEKNIDFDIADDRLIRSHKATRTLGGPIKKYFFKINVYKAFQNLLL
jgi:(E)-4-hydroxy-3-methylbut-2-enyl-diphosphate synthase